MTRLKKKETKPSQFIGGYSNFILHLLEYAQCLLSITIILFENIQFLEIDGLNMRGLRM